MASLDWLSIKDTKGTDDTGDDITYTGLRASGLEADLVGVDAVDFHIWGGVLELNKVSPGANDKLDWNTLSVTGTDLSANGVVGPTNGVDETLGLQIAGNVVFSVADGAVIGRAVDVGSVSGFALTLGKIDATDGGADGFDAAFVDADAASFILNNVDLWIGDGGSLDNQGTSGPDEYDDDTVVNGTTGFRQTITRLDMVSITDLGADATPSATSDDLHYLGLTASGLTTDLLGAVIIDLHIWDGVVNLNWARNDAGGKIDKVDWSSLSVTDGIDLSANNVIDASDGVSEALDLHVEGSAAFDIGNGIVVGVAAGDGSSPGFVFTSGKVTGNDSSGGDPDVSFVDAEAISLLLNTLQIFIGSGGLLSDTTNGTPNATPTVHSDDEVTVGVDAIGFYGELTSMDLLLLTDVGIDTDINTTDDKNYVGLKADGLGAEFVGAEDILIARMWNGSIQYNSASDAAGEKIDKIDWRHLDITSGIELAGNSVADSITGIVEGLDLHIEGNAALNVLDGLLVAVASGAPGFSVDLGQVTTETANSADNIEFTRAEAMWLTIGGASVFIGKGGELSDPDGALLDSGAFTVGFAEQERGTRAAIRNDVDVHGRESYRTRLRSTSPVHGYKL